MPTRKTAPWNKPKPKPKAKKTKLSPKSVAWAKSRAKKAGRRYPNLVDNMAASKKQNSKKNTSRSHP